MASTYNFACRLAFFITIMIRAWSVRFDSSIIESLRRSFYYLTEDGSGHRSDCRDCLSCPVILFEVYWEANKMWWIFGFCCQHQMGLIANAKDTYSIPFWDSSSNVSSFRLCQQIYRLISASLLGFQPIRALSSIFPCTFLSIAVNYWLFPSDCPGHF